HMKIVNSFLVLIPLTVYSQIYENFESGILLNWIQSTPGRWSVDSISPLAGKYSLWHSFDNKEAGTDQTAIRITNLKPSEGNVRWSFLVRHGCDPSSSNNWSLFLMLDTPANEMRPGGNVNGFALGVNLTGNDDTLKLWKIKNGLVYTVIKTEINWQINIGTGKNAEINTERTTSGIWTVLVKLPDGKQFGPFTGNDKELFNTEWFGIFYKYTATLDRRFWFDNLIIEGPFFEDTLPPQIINCIPNSRTSVKLVLDEEVMPEFTDRSNFLLNNNCIPSGDAIIKDPLTFILNFDNEIVNRKTYTLIIKSVCDQNSNCISDIAVNFTPFWVEPGDIIISEIMADPSPPVSLPAKEYLEITSRAEQPVSLKGWTLSSEGQKSFFPDRSIQRGEYIILCSATDSVLFSKYGKVIGLKSFPALTDARKCIWISDSSGNMIHGVEYSPDWYGDRLKAEGGWSLEMIDTGYPFFYEGNWKASSSSSGGTPGRVNSVSANNRDCYFKGLINVFPVDTLHLEISFSEPVKNIEDYMEEIKINGNNIISLIASDPLRRKFNIIPVRAFRIREQYLFSLPVSVTDYAGNKAIETTFVFGLPEPAAKGDVVFNELLFNPLPGDADYIEFCNISAKIINVSSLSVASKNIQEGTISSLKPLSESARCLLPGAYYVMTDDRNSVIARYFSADEKNIFNVSQLPSMPDDKGYLILFNKQLDMIDEILYSEKQHFPLLTGREGVALEKIIPSAVSSHTTSWHSASENSGWGTPGARNSVFIETPSGDGRVTLSSRRLTPDNDGVEDVIGINISLSGSGNVINVTIFDEEGNLVSKPAVNYFIGSEGMVVWDGTSSDGSLVRTGIYIIYISVFDDSGKTEKWKKVCSVLR
ncbi:MAG: lamin tail domain-containing protein, partial [Bacteroidales bacterium]